MGFDKLDEGMPVVGPDMDLTKAPPIIQKRTLAFINHFITHTVRFLNKFSVVCEEKLSDIQVKIQRLEITLSLLEAKLSSIPGLDQVASATTIATSTISSETSQTTEQLLLKSPVQNDENLEETPHTAADSKVNLEIPKLTISKDPRYAKYFKMINVGVPIPAVKGKMAAEGLNPDLLETPDAHSDAKPQADSDNEDSLNNDSSDEASSFSDDDE